MIENIRCNVERLLMYTKITSGSGELKISARHLSVTTPQAYEMQIDQLTVPDPVGLCHTHAIPLSPAGSGSLKELWL